MARFGDAFMSEAQDERFQNRYNYLLDLLDQAYIVEKRIDGIPIKIEMSPKVGLAFYQGGGATGWVYRGGLELVDGELSLVTDVLKGPDSDDAYIKLTSYLDVVIWTALDFYADNSGTPIKVSSILNYFNTDIYFAQWLVTPPAGDDGDINIGVENPDGRSSYFWASVEDWYHGAAMGVALSGTPTEFEVWNDYFGSYHNITKLVEWSTTYFTYKNNTVWHAGNDGAGSTLDADLLDAQEGTHYLHKKTTSASAGAGGAAYWIKVATITFSARYAYAATRIEIIGSPSTAGVPYGCSLYFNAIQQNAFASDPLGVLHLSNASTITTAHIEAVIVTASATESVVEIYVQAIHAYKGLTQFVLEEVGSATISHTLGAWQAALPAGTAMTKALID